MRVLFAGGGTGGHLFPAIAIAEQLDRISGGCQIEFVGTANGIEAKMKDSIGYPLSFISIKGMPRKIALSLFIFPIKLLFSIFQAMRICSRFKPDVVVGTGGYVSGPVLLAAGLKSIPRVIQEQNSYPGLVTRKLAAKVNLAFVAYKGANEHLPEDATIRNIGNPIRPSIVEGERKQAIIEFGLKDDLKTILILGGSQGAHRINEAILKDLHNLNKRIQILWQCGERDYKEVAERLKKKEFDISLFPFSNKMALVYAAADIAIARAGALTISELTACGIPSILIPYPYAADDHQTHNAAEIVASGAARMIADSELENVNLIEMTCRLVESDQYETMRQAAKNAGQPGAAEEIAREIIELVNSKGEQLDHTSHQGND